MPRDATITQEQVNAAADAIRTTGTKPTARAIREAVGGGSMATVLKLLQVWQSGQARTEESPIALPAGLQRALVDYIAQEIASAKVNLQADLVVAQQANNDLIAESERQSSTIELQASALESAQAEKAELVGRLAQVESELARAVEDVAGERHAAEQARTELAKAQLRLEAMPILEAENERLRTALESERLLRTQAQREAATAETKASGLAERLADMQSLLQEQKQHVATLESDKRRLEVEAAALSKESRDLAVRLGKLEGQIAAQQPPQAAAHLLDEPARTGSSSPTEKSSTETLEKAGDKPKKNRTNR